MDRQAEQGSLSARRQELIDRANERGIDWEAAIQDLPEDDDVGIIYGLATLLGLDIWDALDLGKPLYVLEREAVLMERDSQLLARMRFEGAARLQDRELNARPEEE